MNCESAWNSVGGWFCGPVQGQSDCVAPQRWPLCGWEDLVSRAFNGITSLKDCVNSGEFALGAAFQPTTDARLVQKIGLT
jgi:hypothetical protein